MAYKVTLIAGDGIGPEVAGAMRRAVDATGVAIEWDEQEAGGDLVMKYGTTVPDHVFTSLQNNKVGIKGPITTPIGSGFSSPNVALRKRLDLYACCRPVRSLPGVPTRFQDIDLVVVRENTESLYAGLEHMIAPGIVESLKVITESACMKIAQFAFDYAEKNGRIRVAAVHKANIMKLSDGLFLECCRRVHTNYRDIEYREVIVDNCAMQLVSRPEQFDVLLMENLYGDIMSDLCSGLVGGLGVTPGANFGDDIAVFEAVHGSAPDIAGQNKANPTAMMLSAALMLDYLGEPESGERLRKAIDETMAAGIRTRDSGGTASTMEYTDAVVARLG